MGLISRMARVFERGFDVYDDGYAEIAQTTIVQADQPNAC